MNLWQELFRPSIPQPFEPLKEEFNQAWEWAMKQPVIILTVARRNSLLLRRAGVPNKTAEMALIDLWRRSGQGNTDKVAIKAVSVPSRRV
jgi:hypothetical protein